MTSFFKPPVDIDISLDDEDNRKVMELPNKKQGIMDRVPIFEDGESISGVVTLRVRSEGKKVEHNGCKISLMGCVDMRKTDSKPSSTGSTTPLIDTFLCLTADLYPAGDLVHTQSVKFNFKDVQKRYNSYRGTNVEVMYYLKVTVIRKSSDVTKMKKLWVNLYDEKSSLVAEPVKLDIGIENCLHIEFEFAKQHYTLNDVIMGRIYFLLTRLKIKHMELSLLAREKITDSNNLSDTNSIRYEIMDGSPVKGETIPIRLFLSGYELVPNMQLTSFSVKHYLSLVIIDEDGRRYFKQAEVFLHRVRE